MNRRRIALAVLIPATAVLAIVLARPAAGAPAAADPAGPAAAVSDVLPVAAPMVAPRRVAAASADFTGFFGAPAGSVMRHRWKATTSSAIADARGGAVTMKMELQGELIVTVLARVADEALVELVFPVVEGAMATDQGKSPIPRDGELARDLAQPALARLRDTGETLGFRFADGVAAQSRNVLRGLWATLRFQPVGDRDAWTAEESHPQGTATVAYRWVEPRSEGGRIVGGRLGKRVERLTTSDDHRGDELVGAGEGMATFDAELGWHSAVAWRDECTRRVASSGMTLSTVQEIAVDLVDFEWRDVSAAAAAWRGDWSPVGNEADPSVRRRDLGRRAARFRAVSFDQILADLASVAARDGLSGDTGHALFVDLASLLELDAAAMARAQQLVALADARVAGFVLAAMGATQLPTAQDFLARTFADGRNAASLRASAAIAMIGVRAPTAAAVQSVAAGVRAQADFKGDAATGLFALGALVGRTTGPARTAAIASLLAFEGQAIAQGALPEWLEAVGNAGIVEGLSVSDRHRDHADPGVRAGAVAAVRLLTGPAATERLVAFLADAVPGVRITGIEALAQRAEAAAIDAVAAAALGDVDVAVRRAGARALAAHAAVDGVARVLRQLVQQDRDESVRTAAAEALARG